MRHRIVFALFLIGVLVLCGCSARQVATNPDESGNEHYEEGEQGESGEGMPRRRIYQAVLSVEVEDCREALNSLTREAESLGGYVESSRQWDSTPPAARIVLRVPQQQFHSFLAYAESLGELEDRSITTDDITEEYIDLEARLNTRLAHEQRLVELLQKADTIAELMQVESELARIRSEIETLQGRIRYLDDQVDLSRVEVGLRQQEETDIPPLSPMGIGETLRKAGRALSKSVTLFLNFISYGFVILAALLPFLLPAAALVLVWQYLRRKRSLPKDQ